MKIPAARGPLSSGLFGMLQAGPPAFPSQPTGLAAQAHRVTAASADLLSDDDVQLSLFCLFELHYSGLEGVDERWEWDAGLIAVRQELEAGLEASLRSLVTLPPLDAVDSDSVARILFDLAAQDSGPSMSRYVAKTATLDQLEEFLIHKSIYQLKEADPHTWAIPRLTGRAKAALVEIQADEYGGGRPQRMHSALFARTMRGLGLDDSYGAYADAVPAITLAATNMMSLFGLNRRLRGAIAGHLAAYEMTSSQPNRLYGNGFRRHGFDQEVTGYFDEHVEADAVHEQIAGRDLAGGLVESEPALLGDVYFGAAAALAVDSLQTSHIMGAWNEGRSSLRAALPAHA